MIHETPYYWANLALSTRRFGHCYVHAPSRKAVMGWQGFHAHAEGIRFTYVGWGRSLQSAKGHKYKVHARYEDTGKPVPTTILKTIATP